MSWIKLCNDPVPQLEQQLEQAVRAKISAGTFDVDQVTMIAQLDRPVVDGTLLVSDKRLEKLRTLCQLWEVDIRQTRITSHRKVVGPLIVAAKKLIYPFLRLLLKDFIKQQRDFNAATISMVADLAKEQGMLQQERKLLNERNAPSTGSNGTLLA